MVIGWEEPKQNINGHLYHILQRASSSVYLRNLPYPREWNPIDRPHVALLLCEDGQVFRFYLSTPCEERRRLHVWNPQRLSVDSLVEVKFNDMDLRYYRKEEKMWALVGEARNPVYKDFNENGIHLRIDDNESIGPEQLRKF